MYDTAAPSEATSATTDCTSADGRTPLTTRFHPLLASARAMPRPIPRVPPVTSATGLPWRVASVMSARRWSEEGEIRIARSTALHVEGDLAQMVVAPLARLATRGTRASGHVIPPVWPVVHRVKQQALMVRVAAQIGTALVDQRLEDAQPCLLVTAAVLATQRENAPETQQPLC